MNSTSKSLAVKSGSIIASLWTPEQVKLIKEQVAPKATDEELQLFGMVCQKHNLDPFIKQVHCVHRWDSSAQKNRMTIQISIDGFRAIAARTGQYAGSDDPLFDNESNPKKATVTVYRMIDGVRCPFTATARWSEYFPGEKLGFMWKNKPCVMLGKCAEAQALRKAFPEDTSGLFVEEELQKEDRATVSSPSSISYEEALQKISACKNLQELDALKLRLSTDIGSFQPSDQKGIMEEVTKRSQELSGKKGRKKKEVEIIEVHPDVPEVKQEDKIKIMEKINECETVEQLEALKVEIAKVVNSLSVSSEKDALILLCKNRKEKIRNESREETTQSVEEILSPAK